MIAAVLNKFNLYSHPGITKIGGNFRTMDYRTENFFSPAAAAAAAVAPYHYLSQQSSPYSHNPYGSTSYVNGVPGAPSTSPPSNPSAFFGTSPVSQYNPHSIGSASPFSAGISRYAGKFSSGLTKLTSPGAGVSSLYHGSGLASLVASGTTYSGNKDFPEVLMQNSPPQHENTEKLIDIRKDTYDATIKNKCNPPEKNLEKCRSSPCLSVDSVASSAAEGKGRNIFKLFTECFL